MSNVHPLKVAAKFTQARMHGMVLEVLRRAVAGMDRMGVGDRRHVSDLLFFSFLYNVLVTPREASEESAPKRRSSADESQPPLKHAELLEAFRAFLLENTHYNAGSAVFHLVRSVLLLLGCFVSCAWKLDVVV